MRQSPQPLHRSVCFVGTSRSPSRGTGFVPGPWGPKGPLGEETLRPGEGGVWVQPGVPGCWTSRGVFRAETTGRQPPGNLRPHPSPQGTCGLERGKCPGALCWTIQESFISLNKSPSQLKLLAPNALQPSTGSLLQRGTPRPQNGADAGARVPLSASGVRLAQFLKLCKLFKVLPGFSTGFCDHVYFVWTIFAQTEA